MPGDDVEGGRQRHRAGQSEREGQEASGTARLPRHDEQGHAECDVPRAELAGDARFATMADRAAAQRSTGYVIGGISPFGQRKPLPTVVDASALRWDRVLCSAGKRGWDVVVHPQDLIRLTKAVTAEIRAA